LARTKIILPDGGVIRVETKGGCSSGCGATFTVIVVVFVAIGPGYWAATGTWPIWGAVLAYLMVALVIVAALTNAVQAHRRRGNRPPPPAGISLESTPPAPPTVPQPPTPPVDSSGS
jgi:hypothetical protein